DEVEVAVLVAGEPVAGVQPLVPPRVDRCLGLTPVAGHQRPRLVGAQHQLTELTGADFDVVGVHDPGLEPGTDPSAAGFVGQIRAVAYDAARSLGHVERRAYL